MQHRVAETGSGPIRRRSGGGIRRDRSDIRPLDRRQLRRRRLRPQRPGLQPGDRRPHEARSTPPRSRTVDARCARRPMPFPAWRATSLSKRTEIMFKIRNLVDQHRAELAARLTAEHGKVPSDALGEIARGLENLEFATRHPAPAQGRLQRAGLDRRRRLPDPPAARRRRRHHAVQLPGDGPDVDVRRTRSPAATRSS